MTERVTPEGPFTLDHVDAIDCCLEPVPWLFASDHADAIDAHWATLLAALPKMFNGRVLLQHRGAVEQDDTGRRVYRGAYFEAEFKAFLAWRDFGYPMLGVRNGFAMAALRGSDGGFVLGEMGPHTANAGRIYFPSGTPDLSDLVGDRVDLDGSARRELVEETGLDPDDLDFAPGFTLLHDPVRVCCMKLVRSREPADALAARIEAALARDADPELVRIHVVRGEADMRPEMPVFVTDYMRHMFARDL
ncbi:NUDIX hydrolase [Lichenihabitans psoromatis]|uniref:NUDIX hydrolase n=1 Tax=Lichenihabitans psoromatis TaxID=2528642 RepID=UPI0010384F7F|nr:NUDIX hydrolase [Lichenihabitans psoromatis]